MNHPSIDPLASQARQDLKATCDYQPPLKRRGVTAPLIILASGFLVLGIAELPFGSVLSLWGSLSALVLSALFYLAALMI